MKISFPIILIIVLMMPLTSAYTLQVIGGNPFSAAASSPRGSAFNPAGDILATITGSTGSANLTIWERSGDVYTLSAAVTNTTGFGQPEGVVWLSDSLVVVGHSAGNMLTAWDYDSTTNALSAQGPTSHSPGTALAVRDVQTHAGLVIASTDSAASSAYEFTGGILTKSFNYPTHTGCATGGAIAANDEGTVITHECSTNGKSIQIVENIASVLTTVFTGGAIGGQNPASAQFNPVYENFVAVDFENIPGTIDGSIFIVKKNGQADWSIVENETAIGLDPTGLVWTPDGNFLIVQDAGGNTESYSFNNVTGLLTSSNIFGDVYPSASSEARPSFSSDDTHLVTANATSPFFVGYTSNIPITPVPPAPPNFVISHQNGFPFLEWDASSGADYYVVFRDTESHCDTCNGGNPLPLYTAQFNASDNLEYLDTDVVPDTTYYYRVRAIRYSDFGGLWTGELNITTDENLPPTVPLYLTVTLPKHFQINLNWTAPESSGTSPIIHYNIYRQTNDTMTPILYATSETLYFEDTQLACDTLGYNYSVSAENIVGEGPATEWTGWAQPTCRSGTLFGGENGPDSGQIYGPQGRQALAEQMGISPDSVSFLWGFLLLILLTMLGFAIGTDAGYPIPGSILGAITGIILATVWQMFPLGAVIFVGGTAIAAAALIYARGSE